MSKVFARDPERCIHAIRTYGICDACGKHVGTHVSRLGIDHGEDYLAPPMFFEADYD